MNGLLSSRLYDNKNFYRAFEKDLKGDQYSVLNENELLGCLMEEEKVAPGLIKEVA